MNELRRTPRGLRGCGGEGVPALIQAAALTNFIVCFRLFAVFLLPLQNARYFGVLEEL